MQKGGNRGPAKEIAVPDELVGDAGPGDELIHGHFSRLGRQLPALVSRLVVGEAQRRQRGPAVFDGFVIGLDTVGPVGRKLGGRWVQIPAEDLEDQLPLELIPVLGHFLDGHDAGWGCKPVDFEANL